MAKCNQLTTLPFKGLIESKPPAVCIYSYARIYHIFAPVILTLTYELDLGILKIYLLTKINFLSQGFQNLEHEQDRHTQTHGQTRLNVFPVLPHPHSRVVKFPTHWGHADTPVFAC